MAPAWFRLAVPSAVVAGPALVGQPVLFHWPTDGWVRWTAARRSRAAGYSHVLRHGRLSALGAVVAASLLESASHGPGGRWALPRALARAPRFGLSTVTAFRAGQASRPEKRESYCNGEHARDCRLDRA